jgi:hypothetical protein
MLSRRRLISEHGGDAVRITNTTCGAHPGKAGATNEITSRRRLFST